MPAILALFGAGSGAAGGAAGAGAAGGAGGALASSGAAGATAAGSTAGALGASSGGSLLAGGEGAAGASGALVPAAQGSLMSGGEGAAVSGIGAPVAGASAAGSSNLGNIFSLLQHTMKGGMQNGPEGAGFNLGEGLRNMWSGKPVAPGGGESFTQASQGTPVLTGAQSPNMMSMLQDYMKRKQQQPQQQQQQLIPPPPINMVQGSQGISPQIMQLMQALLSHQGRGM